MNRSRKISLYSGRYFKYTVNKVPLTKSRLGCGLLLARNWLSVVTPFIPYIRFIGLNLFHVLSLCAWRIYLSLSLSSFFLPTGWKGAVIYILFTTIINPHRRCGTVRIEHLNQLIQQIPGGLTVGPVAGIKPATSRCGVKRSID